MFRSDRKYLSRYVIFPECSCSLWRNLFRIQEKKQIRMAFFNTSSSVKFKNSTCFRAENAKVISSIIGSNFWNIAHEASSLTFYNGLKSYYPIFNYNATVCNRTNMYQCLDSSACISIHRLLDSTYDCRYVDDENSTFVDNDTLAKLLKYSHCRDQRSPFMML